MNPEEPRRWFLIGPPIYHHQIGLLGEVVTALAAKGHTVKVSRETWGFSVYVEFAGEDPSASRHERESLGDWLDVITQRK